VVNGDEKKQLQLGAAESIKRVRARHAGSGKREAGSATREAGRGKRMAVEWEDGKAQSVYEIRDFVEFKTTWHPIGA
jgi:hypothetical protein